MLTNELIAKLIDLQEKANAHTSEYLKWEHAPGGKTRASVHHRKALKLRSKIQGLIREIAGCQSGPSGN
ncbi:MAG: hypothetical protein WAW37_14395 [Syntrophobacteraceae bacterium]